MELAVHLPLMEFGGEELSRPRLMRAVDAAREYGFAAVSANDHFLFQTPWLDGPTALAAVIDRLGAMQLAIPTRARSNGRPVARLMAVPASDHTGRRQ